MASIIKVFRQILGIPITIIGWLLVIIGMFGVLAFGGQLAFNLVKFMFGTTGTPEQKEVFAKAGIALLLAVGSFIGAAIGMFIANAGSSVGGWESGKELKKNELNVNKQLDADSEPNNEPIEIGKTAELDTLVEILCARCHKLIIQKTADKTGGYCTPCHRIITEREKRYEQ